MNWVNTTLVSISMSVDAMTVGATDGLKDSKMPVWKILLISLLFGLFQFGMPVIGYFISSTFKEYADAYDHWIGFTLLMLLGCKSIFDFVKDQMKRKCNEEIVKKPLSIGEIFVQAIATSIDALCIGFVYMGETIPDAMLIFGMIGITTFVLTLGCVFLAKFIGSKICVLEKYGSLIAGIVFILIATKILLEGLNVINFITLL